jgi:undecaprenyl-diphosphatase
VGWKLAFYILYGLTSGLAELMPISAKAQRYILSELTALDTGHPLMLLMIHAACLAVILIQFRYRIAHMRMELQLEFQDSKKRKRQPDRNTVLDAKVVMFVSIPALVSLLFSEWIYRNWVSLVGVSLCLVVTGVGMYVPQFRPGANRDSRHLSPAEATKLGMWSALSVLPGISRMGMLTAAASVCGTERQHGLNLALLLSIH